MMMIIIIMIIPYFHRVIQSAISTLEYRINGEGVRIIGGGWKWFDITIIGGLE